MGYKNKNGKVYCKLKTRGMQIHQNFAMGLKYKMIYIPILKECMEDKIYHFFINLSKNIA